MKTLLKVLAVLVGIFIFLIVATVAIAFMIPETEADSAETVSEVNVNEENQSVDKDSIRLANIQAKKKRDSIAIATQQSAIDALDSFKSKRDEFEGTSFYRDQRTPNYTNRNFIYPYIGEKDGKYWMRLKFQYAADDWLFINNVKIKTDSNNYEFSGDFERDNNADIWEWADMLVSSQDRVMLHDMANSERTVIRYTGSQYHKDRVLTSKEKSIISETLDVYKNLPKL